MRAHWRKVTFAALWILLLAITLESFIHPDADNKTRAVVFLIVALFAAPVSIVPLAAISVIGWLFPSADGAFLGFLTDDRTAQFLFYGLLMFALSYWQWFHVIPKLTSRFPGRPDA